MKKLLPLLATVSILSCSYTLINYDLSLSEVERPADFTERYGKPVIHKFSEGDTTKYQFEDSLIRITFTANTNQFEFILENKTEHSIKVPWDEAAIIGGNGASMRVIHLGVKYIDKEKPQSPSVIARNSHKFDLLCPVDNISFSSSLGWMIAPLITKADIGQTIQVLLPIEINGTINEYLFRFKVNDVLVKEMYY